MKIVTKCIANRIKSLIHFIVDEEKTPLLHEGKSLIMGWFLWNVFSGLKIILRVRKVL